MRLRPYGGIWVLAEKQTPLIPSQFTRLATSLSIAACSIASDMLRRAALAHLEMAHANAPYFSLEQATKRSTACEEEQRGGVECKILSPSNEAKSARVPQQARARESGKVSLAILALG